MNIRTHCITGLAAGAGLSLYCHQDKQGLLIVSTLALIGAFIPDVPIAVNLVIDKYLLRIDPFSRAKDGDGWFLIKDISHSPFGWLVS